MQLKQYVRNWVCQAPNVGMFFFWWDKSLLNCQFVWISFNKKLRGTSQMHFISMNSSMRLSCPDTLTGTSWCIQVQALNSECYSALNIKGALIGTSWCTSLTQKSIIKWQQRSERRWETDQETEVKFYLLHAHAASLRGVSDKRRLLGEGGAVAVTAVYLKDQKNSRESNISSQTSLNIYQIFNCLMFHSTVSACYPADVLALRSRGERLGADDGVPSHEGDLLVDVRAALLGSNHRAVVGRQQAVHARLLVDLHKENEAV